ncbi:hypothetical protein BHYA_0208g00100 [Botrytis hyacinthi]|uniref:F-box domain-containing protein n=1 Tax=Botrytis hyacinthi TaxID=278943 RepID=A0A4Z1GI94_9HELO|nr:hypothetical protein BHYA_0208g00100 [Botrytis hyacinthi]
MSSPTSVAQRLQKLQLQQQEDIDDVDVEDTVVSPLVDDGADVIGTFKNCPVDIILQIMSELDLVSKVCFSLTGSHFRRVFREYSDVDKYIHGSCHPLTPDTCYAARLSLPLSLQVSKCGNYILDMDKRCFDYLPLDDSEVEWYPTLADLLWNESFFWSGGAQWCDGCYRVLPPASWDQCAMEKEFWDHVESPASTKLLPHEYITDLLARALVQGVKKRREGYSFIGDPDSFIPQIKALSYGGEPYQSRRNDIDLTICAKCRVKKIVTDNGRRQEAWTWGSSGLEDTGKEADGVGMIGHGKNMGRVVYADHLAEPQFEDSWMYFVLWEDILRESGLFVKEYEKVELPCSRSEVSRTSELAELGW